MASAPDSAGTVLSAGGKAERLRHMLSYAVLAPSRHNTQPWIFEIQGDEVHVHADASRSLPATDPDGRELVMACGAAIQNLRVAATHFGFATSLEVVPGVRRDGLLARVRLEERCASRPEIEELFQAIPRRRTNRLPLDGREPPEGLVAALVRDARREGAWLRPVEAHQRRAVADLVAEGDAAQWSSGRFRAELAAWTRTNGTTRRDGMPGYAHGLSDAAALVAPWRVRFTNAGALRSFAKGRWSSSSRSRMMFSAGRGGIQ